MKKIAPKWYGLAQKNLERGDKIQKTWSGEFDGGRGYLVMSNKKLMFIHEEGFLSKKYDLVLDVPYDKINKINQEGRYELDLTETDGKKPYFENYDIGVSIIEKNLKELMSK